jgi:hypothetical protein
MRPELPRLDPAEARRYLSAFVGFWDWHRQPVQTHAVGFRLNLAAMALALIWLRWFAADLPRPAIGLLRFVAVCGAVSIALAFVSWLPPDSVPMALLVLMPNRVLNINAMLAVAMLFGLLGAYRSSTAAHLLVAMLSVGLLLGPRTGLWTTAGHFVDPQVILAIASVGLVLVAVSAARSRGDSRPSVAWIGARIASVSVPGVASLLLLVWAWLHVSSVGWSGFGDARERAVFETAAEGKGLLLSGGDMLLVQLRSRRPVLLDGGGLDALPYSLEAGPAMDQILREVYGIDLFHPPLQARGGGRVPPGVNRAVWERYSLDQWREIRRRYHVTQVLTNADWRLQGLPPLALSRWLKLNEIPE